MKVEAKNLKREAAEQLKSNQMQEIVEEWQSEARVASAVRVEHDEAHLDHELYEAIERLKEDNQGVVNRLKNESYASSVLRIKRHEACDQAKQRDMRSAIVKAGPRWHR